MKKWLNYASSVLINHIEMFLGVLEVEIITEEYKKLPTTLMGLSI